MDNGVDTQEAQVLQAILNGEEVGEAKMQALSAPIRQAIDEMGEEALALGLISQESWERNHGTYVHRVYLRHEADEAGFNAAARMANNWRAGRRKKIVGKELKGRGIFMEVPLARLRRDVPEIGAEMGAKVRMLEKRGINEETGEPTVQKRLYLAADQERPQEMAAFVDTGVWEIRGARAGKVTLWRDYTKAERLKMGEILDARYTVAKTFALMAHDLSTGRFFKDISENPDWTSEDEPDGLWVSADAASRLATFANVDWVQVPDSVIPKTGGKKRYGAIGGKWVRAAIWRDIAEMERMRQPGFWKSIMTFWKLNKTARNPVVHLNNVMSNLVLMDMADVRALDLVRGITSYVREDADYRDALAHGAFGAGMVDQELRRNILEPLLKQLMGQNLGGKSEARATMGVLGTILGGIWDAAKTADRRMIELYQLEDEVFRMATYMRRLGLGDTPAEAAKIAREQFLDYSIRAPWVNAARQTVLPFIAYTYRAVPLIAKAMAQRPWKIAKYAALAYMLNAMGYALTGEDDDDEDRQRRSLDPNTRGYTWLGVPRLIRMPFNDGADNPVFLDIRRWIPAGDVFDLNQGNAAINLPAPLMPGGPLVMGAELLLNRQAFTGKDITNSKTDDIWDKGAKVGDYLWKGWMPSALWVPGSWYWEKLDRAVRGATDRTTGQPVDPIFALASSMGVKLKQQDPRQGFRFREWEFEKVERELKFEQSRAKRDVQDRYISRQEYYDVIRQIREKRKTLHERRRETFRPAAE